MDFIAERVSLYIFSINKRLYETANIEEKDSFWNTKKKLVVRYQKDMSIWGTGFLKIVIKQGVD